MRLIEIVDSDRKDKRYKAIFEDNKRVFSVHFGSSNHENYTMHKDKKRRENYRQRHKGDRLNDPTSPGSLSWFVLWGDNENIEENIKKYKKLFNL
jgi:hypothetical protein